MNKFKTSAHRRKKVREYQLKYRLKPENAAKSVRRSIAWRHAHPKASMLHLTKSRAKKKGVPFNLTLEDIVIPKKCPILGILLVRGSRRQLNAPSLDRRIPSRGYVKGNVQIISTKANVMKNNASKKELLMFADWIRKTYGTTTVPTRAARLRS